MMLAQEQIILNASDIYRKQTYRNRAKILGSNRIHNLIVPVHASSGKTLNKDVKIDNSEPWQRTMRRTVEASYRNSAFYQFYDYIFDPIFTKKFDFILDLQVNSVESCLKALQIKREIVLKNTANLADVTELSAKKPAKIDSTITLQPYIQTFGSVFEPNLSVVDLLFCKGPESMDYLTIKNKCEQ